MNPPQDFAQYAAALAFRLGCREGVGENIAIGEPFRAELERALTEAASLLRSQAEEIARLRGASAEADASFEIQWAADMRAVKRWHKAHPGNDLVLPDRSDLVLWLLEQTANAKLPSEQVRKFALANDHFAIPIRPGVTITWTDEETGEVHARGTVRGRNVVKLSPHTPALNRSGEP